MNIYARLFAFSRYQRVLLSGAFVITFAATMLLILFIGYLNMRAELRGQIDNEIIAFDQFEQGMDHTFDVLLANTALTPCSPAFLHWLRRIAFDPDGVHELIYTEGGRIMCSVTGGLLAQPILLGPPDIIHPSSDNKVWLDRDLGMIGFPGLMGTFIQRGHFILVVPEPELMFNLAPWVDYEIIALGENGKWWHRAGKPDSYMRYREAGSDGFSLKYKAFFNFECGTSQTLCVVTDTPLSRALAGRTPVVAVSILLALCAASGAVFALRRRINRFWSLSSRLQRQLSDDSVVCHYQPLLSLRTDEIASVEVLARWRDLDGKIIFPDVFLPIIEENGLTRPFTEAVMRRAFKDLSSLTDNGEKLRVNFNIFPQDFEAEWLRSVLAEFLAVPERFAVVVELVETAEISVETTREAIAKLRESGIKTFIDDFGVGYSSINYLAGLAADGVKIDRSFAMAPDDSLMATMLTSAIEMIHKTGQEMVVEGVETAERLAALRANNMVDYIQGYHFCRPLELKALAAFMTGYRDAAPAKAKSKDRQSAA